MTSKKMLITQFGLLSIKTNKLKKDFYRMSKEARKVADKVLKQKIELDDTNVKGVCK